MYRYIFFLLYSSSFPTRTFSLECLVCTLNNNENNRTWLLKELVFTKYLPFKLENKVKINFMQVISH